MNHRRHFASITLFLALCFSPLNGAWAQTPMTVGLMVPATEDNVFWRQLVTFMEAVAEDLEVELRVEFMKPEADGRLTQSVVQFRLQSQEFINTFDTIDYFISYHQDEITRGLLRSVDRKGGKLFLINTAISPQEREFFDAPRGRFKSWIGHMYPDEREAGFQLADALLARAFEVKGSQARLETVGIGGTLVEGEEVTGAAAQRNLGLREKVNAEPRAQLKEIVSAGWQPDLARQATSGLLKKYPGLDVIWSASDAMALAAVEVIEESGKTPNRDLFVGGIDWTEDALQAVAEGRLTASVGGHFMEGGWALIVLYDYHHGIDFADELGVQISTRMQVLTQDNVGDYLERFGSEDWGQVDFKRFSKHLNKDLENYDFSIENLLQ
ncbi:MAG: ABC transporter substrate-binding protein [Xanthomonadales bacterium]|nr:ABC transporter substrate-binding protein [Xanthomonadales bacterium]